MRKSDVESKQEIVFFCVLALSRSDESKEKKKQHGPDDIFPACITRDPFSFLCATMSVRHKARRWAFNDDDKTNGNDAQSIPF
jgi:hypothetical protein